MKTKFLLAAGSMLAVSGASLSTPAVAADFTSRIGFSEFSFGYTIDTFLNLPGFGATLENSDSFVLDPESFFADISFASLSSSGDYEISVSFPEPSVWSDVATISFPVTQTNGEVLAQTDVLQAAWQPPLEAWFPSFPSLVIDSALGGIAVTTPNGSEFTADLEEANGELTIEFENDAEFAAFFESCVIQSGAICEIGTTDDGITVLGQSDGLGTFMGDGSFSVKTVVLASTIHSVPSENVVSSVPEPSTLLGLVGVVGGVLATRRRRS